MSKNGVRDWLLWGTLSFLVAYGLVVFFSASLYLSEMSSTNNPYSLFLRQSTYVMIGLVAMWCVTLISTEHLEKYRYILYFGSVFLLLFVLFFGDTSHGSTRWISLFGFTFQPSELAKLTWIIFLAGYINKFQHHMKIHWRYTILAAVPLAGMGTCLILEPDLGATIEIFFLTLCMTFISGAPWTIFILAVIITVSASSLFIWGTGYATSRVLAFLDPWQDPFNKGYNLIQSLMSIGQGELNGVGLGNGIHKLGYLPESHTDFVFSVLAEELGFLGVTLLIIAFAIVLWRLIHMSIRLLHNQQTFPGMVVLGISCWLFFQIVVNISGAIQLLPPKGLVLPFFSKGGSFTLMIGLALGLLWRIEKQYIISGDAAKLNQSRPMNKD